MTYHRQYSVRTVKGQPDQHGMTLYEAEKALAAAAKSGRLQDATRVTRLCAGRERFVAFYCLWRNEVRAAFGANNRERTVIGTDAAALTTPLSR